MPMVMMLGMTMARQTEGALIRPYIRRNSDIRVELMRDGCSCVCVLC
jgi:hypothetical protein